MLFAGVVALGALAGIIGLLRSVHVVVAGTESIVLRWGVVNRVIKPGMHFLPPGDSIHTVQWTRVEEDHAGKSRYVTKRISAFPTTIQMYDPPAVAVTSQDQATVYINGVVKYRIADVQRAVLSISDLYAAIESMIQTTSVAFATKVVAGRFHSESNTLRQMMKDEFTRVFEPLGVVYIDFCIQGIDFSKEMQKSNERLVLSANEHTTRSLTLTNQHEMKTREEELKLQLQLQQAQAEAQLAAQKHRTEMEQRRHETELALLQSKQLCEQKRLAAEAKRSYWVEMQRDTGLTPEQLINLKQIKCAQKSIAGARAILMPHDMVLSGSLLTTLLGQEQ